MGVSKQELLSKILSGKARDLCSPEGDRLISEARNQNRGVNGYNPNPNEYNDYQEFDSMYLNEDSDYDSHDINYTSDNIEYSNLPDNIKESMLKNRIDRSSMGGLSVLDGMDIPKPTPRKMKMNESVSRNYQPQQSYNNGIDYSIIKAIVSECINEYFSKMPLNENSLKTIGLKKGKITLVDNQGNTFVANLEKVGNINSSKKQ